MHVCVAIYLCVACRCVMEDISFGAAELGEGQVARVDAELVRRKLSPMMGKNDLSRFIL